jgi:hypothetical protein
MVFLTTAVAFLSNGYFLAETILEGSIFLVPTTLTGIIGRLRAPIFLAQRAAFLNFCLFGFCLPFPVTFSVLSCLFLGVGTCYYFFDVLKNTQ